MKRLLLIFLLVSAIPLQAQTVQQLFDKSVRMYKQGKYADSTSLLRPLVEKYHRTDGAILYNLAADEFRMHKHGLALFHLLMAEHSSNPQVRSMASVGANRLRRFLTRDQAKQKSAMRRFLFQPFHDFMTTTFSWVGLRIAIWFSLGVWFLGMMFLGLFRMGMARSYSGKLAAGLMVLAVIGAGLALGKYHVVHNYTFGVLVQDANIYKSADSLDPQSHLPEGLEVRVIQTECSMKQIRLSGDTEGFVQADKVRELPKSR